MKWRTGVSDSHIRKKQMYKPVMTLVAALPLALALGAAEIPMTGGGWTCDGEAVTVPHTWNAQVADFFGRLSFPVYMSHFMFLPIHRHYVVQHSANASFAANVCVFIGSYLVILLIGCCVMRFWERVQ